jgi:alpha-ketoglutarate-dependent taurine dioxygenase
MNLKVDSFGKGSAKIISSDETTDIFRLPIPQVQELFKKNGILLFRGFDVTPEQFERFAGQFSSRFIREGGRKSHSGYVEHVDAGKGVVQLHAENALTPFRPELVWFCCSRAATVGGQTTFCDGIALWNGLEESTRKLFLQKKVKYKRRYAPEAWKLFAQPNGTWENLQAFLSPFPGVKLALNEDNSVDSEYVVSAVSTTKYGHMNSFANSVLGAFGGAYIGVKMFFEDGSAIPRDVLLEAESVAKELTEEILWQDGDMAMIDNSWLMHGRRSFYEDNRRQLFSALSWANF